ncbi:MAG: ZIP family metal transporter [Anaerolineales bacterium]
MISGNVWTVFFAALLTALATGLGAIPFFLVREFPRRWLGVFNAIAGGLMLGASLGLINEGTAIDFPLLLLGLIAGVVLISVLNWRLEHDENHHISTIRESGAKKAFLIIGVMTLHSFAEGIGVGVAYGGSDTLGAFITAAIAIHNIPEGLAISLVLVPRGTSPGKAGLWSIFSSLPQPLMAVPAYLLVTQFQPFLPFGLGLAAGAMLWMVVAELIPDALQEISSEMVGLVLTLAVVAMLGFQALL